MEEAVRSIFEGYGTVDRVNVVTGRETGRAGGFAFVDMSNDGAGEAAIDIPREPSRPSVLSRQ